MKVSWKVHHGAPSVLRGDVDVWRIDLDAFASQASVEDRLLISGEVELTTRPINPRDRVRKAAARLALKGVLARYLNVSPPEIHFRRGVFGRPVLHETQNSPGIDFNVSRSHGTALVAVCRDAKVGVDVERVDHSFPVSSVLRQFSGRGLFAVEAAAGHSDPRAFYEMWTRNEAYAKATGLGLTGLVRRSDLLQANDTRSREIQNGWSFTTFDVDHDLIGALAMSSPPNEIHFLDYSISHASFEEKNIACAEL